ncbi:glutamate--tRNA ligase [Candidatus Saccharibacteria bacterium]|nr:glutamate--tRNA ligase [Candidatus Saccharibacteria bacterium]
MSTPVRTRFAPSPTGFMHVGGVRTALFAWLIARQQHGQFILRLEDTDQKREVAGSAEHILVSLNALGVTHDEGPDIGGPHGPYIQSQRLDIYREWAQRLIDAGRAYADPYSVEELEEFRQAAREQKKAFLYRDHRPENPPAWDGSTPLRFKSDPKPYEWHDEVMGDLSTGPEVIDDFILMKSDGYPTYNFAHIVDDAEMQISHVIRGQEFLASMPNYLNLYEALKLERPIFATMPHIMAETGNKKLGKRDGAKDVLDYLKEGYLPETMINFIASLGWNDGTEQEIFTVDELITKFSLDRVQHSGARFDVKRLEWMNGQHIRSLSLDDLSRRAEAFWPSEASEATPEYRRQLLSLVQDRLKTLADLPVLTQYFFTRPTPNWSMLDSNKQLRKLSAEEVTGLLGETRQVLADTDFTPEALQTALNQLLESTGQKPGILFSLIRLSVSWAPFSPALNDTLSVLGKDEALHRIDSAIASRTEAV